MRVVTAISLALIFYFNSTVFSQISNKESFSRHELNEKVLNMNTEKVKTVFENNMNSAITKSSKSPGLALLFSLVLPGAGHYYIDRMDVGKYYLGADAASWLGLATLNIYGNDVQKQSRVFSLEHAKTGNAEGKDDEYYANIGSYDNIYEYNNDKLTRGEYSLLYDVNKFYWDWDDFQNQQIYESQRKSSERIYNTRIVFGSLLVANRIISGISAYLLAKNYNKKSSSVNIQPELLYKNDYSLDGIKINLSKNF